MPEIQSIDAVRGVLAAGPVGIGEDHTQPNARNFVESLIEGGWAKRLFVEYQTGWQPQVDDLEAAVKADPVDAARLRICIDRLLYGQQFRCTAHPLPVLIASALFNGVDVWCCDHWIGGGSARFPTRHQSVRTTYYQKVTGAGDGSVILFGSHHFDDPNHGLDRYIRGLQYYQF